MPTTPRTARPATSGSATRARRGARRRYLPPQHGAWAMLAVPYLAGLIAAGYRWPDLPLLVAWVSGYLLSFFVFQAVKSRRPGRYRDQILLYGGIAAPLAILVVAARPALLWYAPAFGALFGINAVFAWVRRERALLNDVASVLASCLLVPVLATVAGIAPASVLPAAALCLAYFLGTAFYVKTMIRERGNRAYRRWSIGYHLVALGVAAWISPWAGILFGWLLIRASVLPHLGWAPKRVGLVEIANSLLLLLVIVAIA